MPVPKGYKQSEEHKANARKARTYTPLSDETKKKISSKISETLKGNKRRLGTKHSDITRAKMKASAQRGEKMWKWIVDRSLVKLDKERGGPLHKKWSKDVKDRDNWKCRIDNCDCDGKVVAHHILPWRTHIKLRYDINNGITLCKAHHPLKRIDEDKLIPMFQKLVLGILKG